MSDNMSRSETFFFFLGTKRKCETSKSPISAAANFKKEQKQDKSPYLQRFRKINSEMKQEVGGTDSTYMAKR